jgi:tRNA A-37 threonylcarbamoyl transferase component Bud32
MTRNRPNEHRRLGTGEKLRWVLLSAFLCSRLVLLFFTTWKHVLLPQNCSIKAPLIVSLHSVFLILSLTHHFGSMPFVNPLLRKRQRSATSGRIPPNASRKIARIEELLYDGATSNRSVDLSYTGVADKNSLTTRVRRGVSSIMTFFGRSGKSDETALMITDGSELTVNHTGQYAGFTHRNDSNATTLIRSRLALIGASQEDEFELSKSAPATPNVQTRPIPATYITTRLHRSPSSPTLQTKLHNKIQQTFGVQPTVIVRNNLRSRPSVQTLSNSATAWGSQPSSPSTYTGGSGPSPNIANQSTPATSDSTPASPGSVRRYEGISLVDNEQYLVFDHDFLHSSALSTIPEHTWATTLSIKTVEATAAAKIFFESHFNNILNNACPRDLRERALEVCMRELSVPSALQYEARRDWQKHESNNLRLSRAISSPCLLDIARPSVAVSNFEVVKVLGKGSFGVVRLVKEKKWSLLDASQSLISPSAVGRVKTSTRYYKGRRDLIKQRKEVYAMKVIRKSDMLRNGQEGHLRAERDFLVAAESSRWIVPLLAAFQDNKFLYLVMDFCIGGDFLGLLIRKNILSEDVTRWYIAEMILCVEEAHSMKWIHRDVKPDNFLIGADGHLKISDFGLAFDGEWEHDQRFFHRQRYDLVERLGLEVRGDERDVEEQAEVSNSKKVAEMFPPKGCKPSRKHAAPSDDAVEGENIIDRRNRIERRRLARSVVGTSQYMAPEVIRGDLYDGRCD